MQDATTVPHSLQEWMRLLIAAGVGLASSYLPALLKKKQTTAETKRAEAETRHIELTSTLDAGHMMVDLLKLSAQSTLDVERLRREKDFQHARADGLQEEKRAVEAERDLIQAQLDKQISIGRPD